MASRPTDPVRAAMHRPEFDARPGTGIDREELARALAGFLEWLLPRRGCTHPSFTRSAGLRVIAAGWALHPDRFDGLSLLQLAQALGCSDEILSRYAGQFSQRFGVRSAVQVAARKRPRKAASMPEAPADPSLN